MTTIDSDDSALQDAPISRKEQSRLFANFRRKTMVNILRAWREVKGNARHAISGRVDSNLPKEDIERIRRMMTDCIDPKGGDVTARANTVELGRIYLSLSDMGRTRFLKVLAEDFGPDANRITTQIRAYEKAVSAAEKLHARTTLSESLTSQRLVILRQFSGLPDGFKFLVDMRADVMQLTRHDPWMQDLEYDLKTILSSWFDVGLLDLTEITWNSPAALLEKLIAYEAVHRIKSWNDLKNRLDSDRRCYAFFHNKMQQEPLIFVQVALLDKMADSIQYILDETNPVMQADEASNAIFYSISNAQKGLAGISFGNFLIKRVVDKLSREMPHIKQFATLSPIPGFRGWLDPILKAGQSALFERDEVETLRQLTGIAAPHAALVELLQQPKWHETTKISDKLKPILMRLCAHYLIREKSGTKSKDPVAHFHLTNGAWMERLNWLGDVSDKGIAQAAGMMVNYNYRLDDIDDNHEDYVTRGRIAASKTLKALLK